MTKQEAISAMLRGEKVTHDYFDDNEWMTMEDGEIVLEDGVRCEPEEFWNYRQDAMYNDGYSLFK